jgi:hypothetical protein
LHYIAAATVVPLNSGVDAMKRHFAVAAIFALGLFALAPSAHAITNNWFYISPATCSISNGTPASGGLLGLGNNGFAACQIRIPQGGTMVASRAYMTGAQTTFTIQSIPYYSPASATTLASWSGSGSGVWIGSPSFSATVDNQNVSYVFNISVPQAGAFGNYFQLIEITYTTP